jgi:hypothetical protein
VAHPVFKTGGARHSALEGSTPSPFRMSDRDRLRDLPSVDRLSIAVARAELRERCEELFTGTDAGAGETVDLVARARVWLRPRLRRVLSADDETLGRHVHELAAATGGMVVASTAHVGGGALPLLELPGPVVAIDPGPAGVDALAADLRAGDLAVVGRIHDGSLLLDPRTLTDDEAREAVRAVRAVSP